MNQKKVNRQPIRWEEIFPNHISIWQNYIQNISIQGTVKITEQQKSILTENWAMDFNWHSSVILLLGIYQNNFERGTQRVLVCKYS